jgi:hypothetical protein
MTATRVTFGAICFNNSSHFPLKSYSTKRKDAAFAGSFHNRKPTARPDPDATPYTLQVLYFDLSGIIIGRRGRASLAWAVNRSVDSTLQSHA